MRVSNGDHAQDVWRRGELGGSHMSALEKRTLDMLHVSKILEILLHSQYYLSHGRFRSWIWFFTQAGIHPDKHAPLLLHPRVLPRL